MQKLPKDLNFFSALNICFKIELSQIISRLIVWPLTVINPLEPLVINLLNLFRRERYYMLKC